MSSEFLVPQIQTWPPRWPPQTAAARNASGHSSSLEVCNVWETWPLGRGPGKEFWWEILPEVMPQENYKF